MPSDDNLYYGFAQPTAYFGEYNKLRYVIETAMAKLETSLPVRVDAVRGGGLAPVGFVDVTVLVSQVTGDGRTVPGVSVPNVPYLRLQGGDNAVIIDPQPGDIGICLFSSRDISSVKNARAAAPPGSARMYDPSDAMYLGGMLNGAPTQYIQFTEGGIIVHSPTAVTVEAPSVAVTAAGSATVTSPSVSLGASGGTLRALVDERVIAWLDNHVHTSTAVGTPTSVPTTLVPSTTTAATKAN